MERGELFTLALGADWEPVQVPAPLFHRAMRCVGGLHAALGKTALGGAALSELIPAWLELGLPAALVISELLAD